MRQDWSYYLGIGLLFVLCWSFGFIYGRIQYEKPPCAAPQKLDLKSMPAHDRVLWSRYLAARSRG